MTKLIVSSPAEPARTDVPCAGVLHGLPCPSPIDGVPPAQPLCEYGDALLRRADDRMHRMVRVQGMLVGVMSLVVHAKERGTLFAEICRMAVELGCFRGAVIGLVDATSRQVLPVAFGGIDAELLAALHPRLALDDSGRAPGIVDEAIATRLPVVVNRIRSDVRIHSKAECRENGIESVVILPLVVSGRVEGMLALLAAQVDYFDDDEIVLLAGLAEDISFAMDHIHKCERLQFLAYYDLLTGLANRGLFLERVGQFIRSATTDDRKPAVLLLDLERFRNINDSLGQPAGDALLQQVAQWLIDECGDASLLARIDADHFAIVMPAVNHEGDVARLLDRIIDALVARRFDVGAEPLRVAAKAGVAMFPVDGTTAEDLFKHAEVSLKKAQEAGERYLFHAGAATAATSGRLSLEMQLRHALENDEFVLHYQPKFELAGGRLIGAEALIRWNDPRTGLVPPGRFIPILEETGLILGVGNWAIRQALADYQRWSDAGLAPVRVAVNISALQLRNRGFLAELEQALATRADACDALELEITESMIMQDVAEGIAVLHAIRALGVTIAIDDFGTGFSSLGYLARLPVDALKIDRSFVQEISVSPQGMSLVSTIIHLAHSFQLEVVAEGVETEEQARMLGLLKCDQVQGFHYSRPVPVADFESRFLQPALIAPAGSPIPSSRQPFVARARRVVS